ncbi:MAG TPA: M18 family aminopeptidase [Turneriella sp.]|nr:M18 family aminopeptidase [Turneriella sp.]HNL09340.1 M18 family aminopeptidase [Turneriella sp.]HNN00703.1 M18 family aminopeptidase [Turneriella sp.]
MELVEYLDNSPSPAWATETAAGLLDRSGFSQAESVASASSRQFYLRPHAGLLLAVRLPEKTPKGFRLIGAHTDSPHLRLKANAAQLREGYALLASEVYGGALLYTWFDRALALAGEIFYRDGESIKSHLVRSKGAIAIVPSLAIHLQRGVNDDGFAPNKQVALSALVTHRAADFNWNNYLATLAGIPAEKILSYDLSLYDAQAAEIGGALGDLLFSARLDNLVSCHSALTALTKSNTSPYAQVVALYDHEEIGSLSESGAETRLTEALLSEIAVRYQLSTTDYQNLLRESVFLSADMAHGVHPNFADRHDTENRPRLGGGITLKINQNRRYATSAATHALFSDICRRHHIDHQVYTHRNDLPCGSTIGPTMSARLGMPTLDVGVAMLGMHSARETCAWADVETYSRFMKFFLSGD